MNPRHVTAQDYQAAGYANSGTASQTGADRAGLCRFSDARVVVFDRCGGRRTRHCDLAARMAPEAVHFRCLMKKRAQGKPGAHDTRSRAHKNAHGGPQVRRNTRPSLRSGFNGLCRALPGDEFVLPPSPTDLRFIEGLGSTISISLTPATGAGTTRFCRPQLPRAEALRPARMLPEEVSTEAFKRRSSARRSIAHGNPPCNHARARRCRVHRNLSQRS
jgi:hypothetical protein